MQVLRNGMLSLFASYGFNNPSLAGRASSSVTYHIQPSYSSVPLEFRRQYVPFLTHSRISNNIRSASYLNPLNWVKEKLGPAIREKQAKEEVEAGKQQAAEEGTQSVFEALPTPVRQKSSSKRPPSVGVFGVRKPAKPRPTSVCSMVL